MGTTHEQEAALLEALVGAGKAAEPHNEGCNGLHRGHMAGTSTWGCSFVVCASSEGPLLIKGLFYYYYFDR